MTRQEYRAGRSHSRPRGATPKWLGPVLVAVIAVAALVMVGLGVWQLERLGQRRADNIVLGARLAAPPVDLNADPAAPLLEYQPLQATGVYDFAQEIVLRNRAYGEAPGVHVLTPLRLTGSDVAVLVDRGWIPYTAAAPADRAAFQAPTGEVTVVGLVRLSQTRSMAFLPADPTASPAQPRLDAWFWPDLTQIQAQLPYALLGVYLEADAPPAAAAGAPPQALPYAGHTYDLSDGPHLSYAIQWFAFAATLVIGSVALWRQRRAASRAATD